MNLSANNLGTSLAITALVAVMVILLPWADRRICRRLHLNLGGGLSENPRADRLLRIRKGLLTAGFLLYLVIFAYFVFFSRTATEDYQVHVAVLEDLANSVQTDHGFSDVLQTLFSEGPAAALDRVRIVRLRDILQFYMNMMLFIPMGYLLPYVFSWFRARVSRWPALACFLFSVAVENLQLVTRRGFYDLDDLISNTLGGIIGQLLFIAVAYVVTVPGWRKNVREWRQWKKDTRGHALPMYERRLQISRTVLYGSDPVRIYEFFADQLGFRLLKRVPLNEKGQAEFLFQLGHLQVSVLCRIGAPVERDQFLTLSTSRMADIRKWLEAEGIEPSPYTADPYTGLRTMEFAGPDRIHVRLTEESLGSR
ncbi:MAG: VanZ family protein [Clostridia bacterium]|nr:VanZ family protein [Clostridia bacterium]